MPRRRRHGLGMRIWIRGCGGGGKSTIACRIATRHGLYLDATDDAMSDHIG
jgi:adenylate kinase family enzyme